MLLRCSCVCTLLVLCSACGAQSPTAPAVNGPSSSRTVYVSLNGSDGNDGALGSPWQTLRYAVAKLRSGDTLYIRGGTYNTSEDTIDSELGEVPSGNSWSNAITIAAHPSERVTIRPPR